MKMDSRALAITSAAVWGGAVLAVATVNLFVPSYGSGFLKWMASFYPGYNARRTPGQVAIGTAYAAIDGAACGYAIARLYNHLADEPESEMDKARLRAAG